MPVSGAQITLDSLGVLFNSARGIMHWLADCAKVIAKDEKPVQWTTPLGLPVVQPYRWVPPAQCSARMIGEPIKRLTEVIAEPIKLTGAPQPAAHALRESGFRA